MTHKFVGQGVPYEMMKIRKGIKKALKSSYPKSPKTKIFIPNYPKSQLSTNSVKRSSRS